MKTEVEKNLLRALVELEEIIKSIRTGGEKPNLLPLFSRIDVLAKRLPAGTDHNLLHYLHKKSYEKARLYLQGRDEENLQGRCR